jgi:hypothetical protein
MTQISGSRQGVKMPAKGHKPRSYWTNFDIKLTTRFFRTNGEYHIHAYKHENERAVDSRVLHVTTRYNEHMAVFEFLKSLNPAQSRSIVESAD